MSRVAVSLALLVLSAPERPALEGFPEKRVTLELRQVKARNFFDAVARAGQVQVQLDACAQEREVTIGLRETPLRQVVELVGEQLRLSYRFDGHALRVGCRG